MMWGQSTEVVDGTVRALEGRSDAVFVLIAGMVFVGLVLYRDFRRQLKEDERQDEREKNQRIRDETDSKSLDTIAHAMQQMSKATEIVVTTVKELERQQGRDRRALLALMDSVDAKNGNDDVRAERQMQQVRIILMGGE